MEICSFADRSARRRRWRARRGEAIDPRGVDAVVDGVEEAVAAGGGVEGASDRSACGRSAPAGL
jgi:hypothetical protein